MPKGLPGIVAGLIALGLILRFGKTSVALTQTGFSGMNDFVGTLALTKFTGNAP